MENAFEAGLRLLRHRDRPASELRRRLGDRGFEVTEIDEALSRLTRTGLVDDGRYAELRAASLAARGAGDALIRSDLDASGVGGDTIGTALAALDPEEERACAIARRRGAGARTLRYLAAKGFDAEVLQALVADRAEDELG